MSKKQEKQNYEHLLTRIEMLEEKIKVLEFLQNHKEEEVVITHDIVCEPLCSEVEVYANLLNYEKDKVLKLFLYSVPSSNAYCYTEEVVRHDERPFYFIEVRCDGILTQAFKVDKFLEKVWAQDICLYAKAYNVKTDIYGLGGKEVGNNKRNSRKVDVDTEWVGRFNGRNNNYAVEVGKWFSEA